MSHHSHSHTMSNSKTLKIYTYVRFMLTLQYTRLNRLRHVLITHQCQYTFLYPWKELWETLVLLFIQENMSLTKANFFVNMKFTQS